MIHEFMKAKELAGNPSNCCYERKYDGSRHMAVLGTLISERDRIKNGHYPQIASELQKFKNCVLDGEVYVEGGSVLQLNASENWGKAKFCVFDILNFEGEDTRNLPLRNRKFILKNLIKGCQNIHLPMEFATLKQGQDYIRGNKLEGLVVKNLDSVYREGMRSNDWLKWKMRNCVDVEIIGHEQGSVKGAFIIRMPDGTEGKVSAKSKEILDYYKEKKPLKAEISYLFITETGKPFQPVLNKFIEG